MIYSVMSWNYSYENCGSSKIKIICFYRVAWVSTASSFLPASVSRHLSTSGWSSQRPKTRPFLRPASFLLRETRWILSWRAKTLEIKEKGVESSEQEIKNTFLWMGRGSFTQDTFLRLSAVLWNIFFFTRLFF